MKSVNQLVGGLFEIEINSQLHLFDDNGNSVIVFEITDQNKKLYTYNHINYSIYSTHNGNGKTIYFGEDGSDDEIAIVIENQKTKIQKIKTNEIINFLITNNHKEE